MGVRKLPRNGSRRAQMKNPETIELSVKLEQGRRKEIPFFRCGPLISEPTKPDIKNIKNWADYSTKLSISNQAAELGRQATETAVPEKLKSTGL